MSILSCMIILLNIVFCDRGTSSGTIFGSENGLSEGVAVIKNVTRKEGESVSFICDVENQGKKTITERKSLCCYSKHTFSNINSRSKDLWSLLHVNSFLCTLLATAINQSFKWKFWILNCIASRLTIFSFEMYNICCIHNFLYFLHPIPVRRQHLLNLSHSIQEAICLFGEFWKVLLRTGWLAFYISPHVIDEESHNSEFLCLVN